MTTANAIKKLERAGYTPIVTGGDWTKSIIIEKEVTGADQRAHTLTMKISIQGGEVIIISTGPRNEESDCRSYWDNLTQALRHW